MKTTNTDRAERKTNGQFSHGFDKMCTCGKRKGEHMAEAPFDLEEGDHYCPGFKLAPKVKR